MKKISSTSPIAFFCAEYALQSDLPTYAGGLGVLAGDMLLEASKENIDFLLVSLRYGAVDVTKNGYKKVTNKKGEPLVLSIPIADKKIFFSAWMVSFGTAKILLIDPDVAENSAEDRILCAELYDSHFYTRISQQMLLGLGGTAILAVLDINPSIYHLNEGHTGITAMGIIVREMKNGADFERAVTAAREKTIATKHTILSTAGTYIPSGEFKKIFGGICDEHKIQLMDMYNLGKFELDHDMFSTTKFLLAMSIRHNAVSRLHMEKERQIHPKSDLTYITNGVSVGRWQAKVFSESLKDGTPERLWAAKNQMREELVSFVKTKTGKTLDPDICTIVWARRLAAYKQPELLFSDINRLKKICASRKVQFIFAGKAHKADEWAQKVAQKLQSISEDPFFLGRIVYIPDYNLDIADILVAGADVWLNTPERGNEACGTSGMKAGLNAAVMCSTSDGWMDEVDWQGIGWTLPEENTANAIYDVIEKEIIPAFYARTLKRIPESWMNHIRATMNIVSLKYSAKRMLNEYIEKMYRLKN
ncbi:MAG TPA: alpha-glucan family phosphorylase [Candidatus Paceibacterota bacterium]|nr:alpha-glucan family phosphorylase [Candidatus Paceibacterota bacterium]